MPGTDPHVSAPVSGEQAMARAVSLAALGPAHGPNPRVGAVLVDDSGRVLGEGYHRGAGTAHAEVAAIADAVARGQDVAGSTAYVTLEPCAHTGRTGPCTDALAAAGVTSVRYGAADPNPVARGGGEVLRSRGIDARLERSAAAEQLNERWTLAVTRGRPYVVAKWGQTLDGRIAAADGTSKWITGEPSREHAHRVRSEADAIIVGTGTVLSDDPELSARPAGVAAPHQPLRVVLGDRATEGARVWRDDNSLAIRGHDVADALEQLAEREIRTAIVEGGGTVLTAFLGAGLVDELHVYIAPVLLGDGTAAVSGLGIATMADALRPAQAHTLSLGADTLITARFEGKDRDVHRHH